MKKLALAAAALLGAALTLSSQDGEPKDKEAKVPNPDYQAWSAFKPGSMVRLRQSEKKALPAESEIVRKLVALTDAAAIVETTRSELIGDAKQELATLREEIPAMIAPPAKDAPGEAAPREGQETLEVAGKPLKCRWVEKAFTLDGKTTVTKTWSSGEVPGGLVRKDVRNEGEPDLQLRLTILEYLRK